MLGLAFNPVTAICWCSISAPARSSTSIRSPATLDGHKPTIANSGLNALTFDNSGNAYMSDSFDGIIWKIGPTAARDGVGRPAAQPGHGAHPAVRRQRRRVQQRRTPSCMSPTRRASDHPDPGETGRQRRHAIDPDHRHQCARRHCHRRQDNIWICANQEDEIVVIDKTGKVIAKLGDFRGIDQNGIAQGLLFPASPAFSKDKPRSMSRT